MIVLRVGGDVSADVLEQVKLAALRFPGTERLRIVVEHVEGSRVESRVTLGDEWRYDASPECLAALGEFGSVIDGG